MKSAIFFTFIIFGQILCQSNANYQYADVVYILDESAMSRVEMINFLSNFIPRLEENLISSGLGAQPGINANNYGIVLFGSNEHTIPYRVPFNGNLLVEPVQFASLVLNEIPLTSGIGDLADGWAAIDSALGYPLRPNALHKFIFMSPRYRQITNLDITRNSLINRLMQQQVILNMIVNVSYAQNNESPDNMLTKTFGLLHYGRERASATLDNVKQGLNFTSGGRILGPMSSFTSSDDYVFLVQDIARSQCLPATPILAGSSWDYKFVQRNGQDLEFFIQALLASIKIEANSSLLATLPLPNQPIIQCPYLQYNPMIINDNLFFMLNGQYTFEQARKACIDQHAQLAIIQNAQEAIALQSFNSPAWIGAFVGQSNQMSTASNLVAIRGGQMFFAQNTDPLNALCYVSPTPLSCNNPGAKP